MNLSFLGFPSGAPPSVCEGGFFWGLAFLGLPIFAFEFLFSIFDFRTFYFLLHHTIVTPTHTTAIPIHRFRLTRSPRNAFAPNAPAA